MLGSGFNGLVDHVEISHKVEYSSFLDFDILALEGHERVLYEAKLDNVEILILSGKLHAYEGYNYNQIISPIEYVDKNYNVDQWIITSASGGLSSRAVVGEWHQISNLISLDTINRVQSNKSYALDQCAGCTYAFQTGPSLGTVAEYKILSKLQADMVGMSMLPESTYLKGKRKSINLYTLPVCTYYPIENNITEPSHSEVIVIANRSVIKLLSILRNLS